MLYYTASMLQYYAMSMSTRPSVLPLPTLEIISQCPAQTVRVGQRIGALLVRGDLVLLFGEFGAGKTHLTKGIAQGLGAQELVNSPSFVLINEYRADDARGHFPIYHIDLYRLDGAAEIAGIGLDEALAGDGVCVIEWAEKAHDWLPAEHLAVHLAHLTAETRRLQLVPHGQRYSVLVAALEQHSDALHATACSHGRA